MFLCLLIDTDNSEVDFQPNFYSHAKKNKEQKKNNILIILISITKYCD